MKITLEKFLIDQGISYQTFLEAVRKTYDYRREEFPHSKIMLQFVDCNLPFDNIFDILEGDASQEAKEILAEGKPLIMLGVFNFCIDWQLCDSMIGESGRNWGRIHHKWDKLLHESNAIRDYSSVRFRMPIGIGLDPIKLETEFKLDDI